MKALITITAALIAFNSQAIELYGLDTSSRHQVREITLSKSGERDIKRALRNGYLNKDRSHFEYALVSFKERNGSKWKLQVIQNMRRPDGPTFFVPHDSENEAFQTAAFGIKKYGGHLIAFECQEKRTCSKGIDPNRFFLNRNSIYVETILSFYKDKNYPVYTLHNNGAGHRSINNSGKKGKKGFGAIYAIKNPYRGGKGTYNSGDRDNLVIFTDKKKSSESDLFADLEDIFKELGMNHIFEYVRPNADLKGHMSTYVLLNTDQIYFNIETEHGQLKAQIAYLKNMMRIADDLNLN